MKRAIFFSSFFSTHFSGSKFFTSPAIWQSNALDIEVGDAADAALSGQQIAPHFFGADAATADQPNTRHDNSAVQRKTLLFGMG